jgi:5-methylcytosine-specific restriction endonuclease McrA
MEGRALLLNASFQPLQVISWQKAVQLFYLGKVEVIEASHREVRSVTVRIKVPLVIRLIRFIPHRIKREVVRFNRNNIFLRDAYQCQYCGKLPKADELTLDHVIPVVMGGPKVWENIVTSCRTCNQTKGGRTPQEANMVLLKKPRCPGWLPFMDTDIEFTRLSESLKKLVRLYGQFG